MKPIRINLPLAPVLVSFTAFLLEVWLITQCTSIAMALAFMCLIAVKQCCWLVAMSKMTITYTEKRDGYFRYIVSKIRGY